MCHRRNRHSILKTQRFFYSPCRGSHQAGAIATSAAPASSGRLHYQVANARGARTSEGQTSSGVLPESPCITPAYRVSHQAVPTAHLRGAGMASESYCALNARPVMPALSAPSR